MTQQNLALVLRNALDDNQLDDALAAVKDLRPIDVAEVLVQLDPALGWRLLERLPKRAEIFAYFEPEQQMRLVQALPRVSLAQLISEMPADERVDLFKRFDQRQRDALLPALAQAEREDIRKLSAYVEGTAGALLTSDYATLLEGMTVSEALDALRNEAPDAETIYHAYVIDGQRHLQGVVSLRELILADPATHVRELMVRDVVAAHTGDDQERIAKLIARYDLLALPICDENERLVGIVTYDDAMDVVSEEATVDIHKGAGVSAHTGNYKDAGIGLLYRKRVFWLVLLVFGNLFSGAGIAHFEDVIAANLVLVFFLPLLVGSGGNAGSQSSTLMVRALATGEVELRDWLRLLGRELAIAVALGGTMAVAMVGIGWLRGGPEIALVVAASMLVIVLIGCLIGMSLPFVLSRLRLDPASASAPLVTSICDVSGVVIYLYIASRIFSLPV
ncbi:MAG: magnesium transporter [Porticoccaceae bacterium]|jgi:magnesium transporter